LMVAASATPVARTRIRATLTMSKLARLMLSSS
jgi:hypothetical protein